MVEFPGSIPSTLPTPHRQKKKYRPCQVPAGLPQKSQALLGAHKNGASPLETIWQVLKALKICLHRTQLFHAWVLEEDARGLHSQPAHNSSKQFDLQSPQTASHPNVHQQQEG